MAFLPLECLVSLGLLVQHILVKVGNEVFRNLEGLVGRFRILFSINYQFFWQGKFLVASRMHVGEINDFVFRCLFEFYQDSTFIIDS